MRQNTAETAPEPSTNGSASALTRSQVATALGMSVSSVRRLEGDKLHPDVDDAGVRRFDVDEVMALARQLRPLPKNTLGKQKLSKGELAARAFECFEQRQSLSEVVIGLRLEPDRVRKLYKQWRLGLENGFYERHKDSAAPLPMLTPTGKQGCLERFASLPIGQETRISVARYLWDLTNHELSIEYQEFEEQCGFVAFGPITIADLRDRYGTGAQFRVSAYSLTERRMLWEILTSEGVI